MMMQDLSWNRPQLKSLGRRADENNKTKEVKTLRLALLGCETNEPYGPIQHTGELFLALLDQASNGRTEFQIDLYNAKEEDFPDDWEIYDGVILPGSFSAAYDTDPWILRLQHIIQNVIVTKQIPTLGTCFGHQVFAHSFQGGTSTGGGRAIATPTGARGGRFTMPILPQHHPQTWWPEDKSPDLYYTHGDMVAQLPETAVCLGGDDNVPVQAAAYFGTSKEKNDWLYGCSVDAKQPFAVTFQAHPEYATSMDRGVERTLCQCLKAQADRGVIANPEQAMEDAIASFELVKNDSIMIVRKVMEMLGWD